MSAVQKTFEIGAFFRVAGESKSLQVTQQDRAGSVVEDLEILGPELFFLHPLPCPSPLDLQRREVLELNSELPSDPWFPPLDHISHITLGDTAELPPYQ